MIDLTEKQGDKIIELLETMSDKIDNIEPTVIYAVRGTTARMNIITSEGVAKVLGDIQHTTEKGRNISRMLKDVLDHVR